MHENLIKHEERCMKILESMKNCVNLEFIPGNNARNEKTCEDGYIGT
jgi:hypothetical protein